MTCDYEEHYYRRDAYGGEVGYPDYFGAESVERRANADVFAELILSVAPAVATSLDVGCGGGYLVNALSGLGIAAMGTDSSEFAIGHARRSGVGRFEQLSVHEVPAAALGQFDVVTMMDVIEHLKDPLGAVGTASRMVRPGGLLMILTPRYGGSLLVKQGADYVHFNYDHVYYFTEDTLRAVIDRSALCSAVRIRGVVDWITARSVEAGPTFLRKYRDERDSMIAIATIDGQT